jgi:excisionase family DNA binding protein
MPKNQRDLREERDEVLTVQEAAYYLKVTVNSMYQRVARREIRHLKMGRLLRFRKSDLDAFLESCETSQ